MGDAFEKLDAGECTGVVNGETENTPLLKNGQHCDKMPVGPSVMSIMLSQPISHDYAAAVSWLTLKHRSELFLNIPKYTSTDLCKAKASDAQKSGNDGQMQISDFIGVFIITGIGMAFAFLTRIVNVLRAKISPKPEKDDGQQPGIGVVCRVGSDMKPSDP